MKGTRLFTNSRPDVRARRSRILALVLVALMLSYTPLNGVHAADSSKLAKQPGHSSTLNRPDQANQAGVRRAFGKLPLSFEANRGQVDRGVKFLIRRNVSNTIIRMLNIYNPWVQTDRASNTFSDNKEPPEIGALTFKC